jgi:hypothetical protein
MVVVGTPPGLPNKAAERGHQLAESSLHQTVTWCVERRGCDVLDTQFLAKRRPYRAGLLDFSVCSHCHWGKEPGDPSR